ncbi:MAG TPA: methyltransferase [Dehalococcoidales bacterium]|nr:methyltransferase [Dehalococcoidales bacterium]
MAEDVYYKKTLTFNGWKHSFQFKTSQELFSSHAVDTGTRQLLRTIVEAGLSGFNQILDLGCGYGPVGLVLKALCPDSVVHLVDKDALALEYSRQNADLNRLTGLRIYPSLGYDDLKERGFDLIVSNIPGKAGEPVISYWLREAGYFLAPNGMAAVVVVNPLEPLVAKTLAETPSVNIIFKHTWADHTVFHYRFTGSEGFKTAPPAAFERGIFTRTRQSYHSGGIDYSLETAYGLADFDSTGNENDLLFSTLSQLPVSAPASILVFNPGQGHSAVILWKKFHPDRIWLADRDCLALRYSRRNLGLNLCPAERVFEKHTLGLEGLPAEKINLAAIAIREEEGPLAHLAVMRQLEPALAKDAVVLVSSGSTAVTRLADSLKQHKLYLIQHRERWRGQSLLVLTRRH